MTIFRGLFRYRSQWRFALYSPSVSLRSTAPLAGSKNFVFSSESNERGDPDRSQNGLFLIWIASLSLAMTG